MWWCQFRHRKVRWCVRGDTGRQWALPRSQDFESLPCSVPWGRRARLNLLMLPHTFISLVWHSPGVDRILLPKERQIWVEAHVESMCLPCYKWCLLFTKIIFDVSLIRFCLFLLFCIWREVRTWTMGVSENWATSPFTCLCLWMNVCTRVQRAYTDLDVVYAQDLNYFAVWITEHGVLMNCQFWFLPFGIKFKILKK